MMSSVEVPGNYFADWSSQSSVSSDILTGEWYHMTMGMMEWMWLAPSIAALLHCFYRFCFCLLECLRAYLLQTF